MSSEILLVDDDAIQAATRKTILERAGHTVSVASDGPAALKFMQAPESFSVRLLITDHSMPGMNGPDLVRALREAAFQFPVLVLSGFVDAEDAYEGLNVSFRVKPFPPDQLIAFVDYLLHAFQRRTA